MLEIKNVTKVYNTKGGVSTLALNDVSITFGDTGMVFLLGKSGSGKSTLLNISGGLDEPTSGEVIVRGKSSKEFSGSDFDSYRNTFVGFIFQEYNILDEFNVEDNVALALELQGKPKDREKINAILQDVELEAYAYRKPNTLSGGQKQRIAIARALVKDPQIIMADEPTGALDSATGKQVFDTLKKLSKTRLVMVVSHDREFAEIYGDRIVELADGKIISDVTKSRVPPKQLDDNISLLGDNTISIKSGTSLTEDNLNTIKQFIKGSSGDVIISKGESEIGSFKKANKMGQDGFSETFSDTGEVKTAAYTAEDSKFIRSRLPALKAIKIGASGLKLKPVRLVFTILLSVIAFVMFGLFSTLMMYNGRNVAISSFMQSDYEWLSISKSYKSTVTYDDEDYSYNYYTDVGLTEAEVLSFREKFGEDSFGYYSYGSRIGNVSVEERYKNYYFTNIEKFAYSPAIAKSSDFVGSYPKEANEICVSDYIYDLCNENVLYLCDFDSEGKVEIKKDNVAAINSKNDLLDKYLVFDLGDKVAFKITGVFKSENIPSKYDELKDPANRDYMTQYAFSNFLQSGFSQMCLVSEKFIGEYADMFLKNNRIEYLEAFSYVDNFLEFTYGGMTYNVENAKWTETGDTNYVCSANGVKAYGGEDMLNVIFIGGEQKSKLNDNEVILSIEALRSGIVEVPMINYYMSVSPSDTEESYYYAREKYDEFLSDLECYLRGEKYSYIDSDYKTYTQEERLHFFERVTETLKNLKEYANITLSVDGMINDTLSVAGFYYFDNPNQYKSYQEGVYFSEAYIRNFRYYENNRQTSTNYKPEEGAYYSGIMIPYDGSERVIAKVLDNTGYEHILENDVIYNFDNPLYGTIETVNELVGMLSTVFLWVGVVFAVFSALLLFNFISVSIANKRKEIGILRAVGARGLDVFKIFFSESGIIVGICTVLALIGTAVVCMAINSIIMVQVGVSVTLFVFGIVPIVTLVGIAVVVAVISTFLPVYLASRKKPVDSIRAL